MQRQRSKHASLHRKHPVKLSITHNFRPDDGAQLDVGEARQSAPHDGVAWRRIVGAGEIAAESGDLGQVV